jgi:hypothetical protein
MSVLDLTDAAPAVTDSSVDEPEPARGPAAYDPAIASDGLTVDTPLGPVDLVAIDQAVRGIDTPLTLAERAWIAQLRRRSPAD